jgi:hypothetical protein
MEIPIKKMVGNPISLSFQKSTINEWLVVWNMTFLTFHKLGMPSSQLTSPHIFQRGRLKPPITTNQNNKPSPYEPKC